MVENKVFFITFELILIVAVQDATVGVGWGITVGVGCRLNADAPQANTQSVFVFFPI